MFRTASRKSRSEDSAWNRVRQAISRRQLDRLQRSLLLVWKSAPGWTASGAVLMVVLSVLPLLALWLMKLLIDAAVGVDGPGSALGSVRDLSRVNLLIVLLGIVALAKAACESAVSAIGELRTQRVRDHIQNLLQRKSSTIDLAHYENPDYYDTLHRAQEQSPMRTDRIFFEPGANDSKRHILRRHRRASDRIQLDGPGHRRPRLPAFGFHQGKYALSVYLLNRRQSEAERKAWYYNWIVTRNPYAKEVRLFDLGDLFRKRYRRERAGLVKERTALVAGRAFRETVTQAFAVAAIYGSYGIVVWQTVQGACTPGDLVMYIQAIQKGQNLFQGMLKSMANFYEDYLFLSNLFDFLDLESAIVAPERPVPVPRPMRTGIRFEGVGFRYAASARHALRSITLSIEPGEVVALVGENGSGKTSLVKLLCRLYDPSEGRIAIDGIDLRQFDPRLLRKEIGVIFQDFAQYHQAARDNIRFGNIDIEPGDGRIQAAAKEAGAHTAISALPQGYDTMLGKFFREGEELSIGEWQKIALARALLRDAQILVLDEPTSALDALSEYRVFRQFRELVRGRTAILVSHRLYTVKMADRICVMKDGEIVEQGSHSDLMDTRGLYARMFETQAECYSLGERGV